MTSYQHAIVDGSKIFYREAGSKTAPTILLLHGFPTSSHMFRNLIPALADRYHVVAPDLPGFGFSDAPDRKQFRYTFEHLAKVIDSFTQTIGLERYAIYVFDYGAPVGLRLALAHPERVTAIISQNGNAYEEGLSQGWNPIQKYWKEPTPDNRTALRDFLTPEATKSQYLYGVQDETLVAPATSAVGTALPSVPIFVYPGGVSAVTAVGNAAASFPINYGNVVAGSLPLAVGVNSTYFYVRWTGVLTVPTSGNYTLGLNVSDGADLYVGSQFMVNVLKGSQSANSTTTYTQSTTLQLAANVPYPVVIEWQHGGPQSESPYVNDYQIQLLWTPPGGTVEVIPAQYLSLSGVWWNGTSGSWFPSTWY